ncbi:TolC family protein [Pricia sp. S334]|uniref:TolC family protein n=1 Tax=Pricia mediterranea TaxID=3076079 RepID=A0ABU3L413_9FLAO|nr:TolC family protein [Pricia sp. S334]MDT7828486.1 TolC family protein [Pricia sp. S334]
MNRNSTIAFIILILLGTQLQAQSTWTLDECIAYALENNLQMNNFEYAAQSDRETYRQSVRNLLPSVNGQTQYTINFGRSTDPFTNDVVTTDFFSNNYTLETAVDLFRGFQKINTIKATKFLYRATKEERLQEQYLLAFRVMQAFYDIQFYKGLVGISEEQLQVSQSNYDLVEKQIELGLKAGADLYEAESLLLTDKLNLTQSKNQLAAAELALIQEMNLEGAENIEIQEGIAQKDSEGTFPEIGSDSVFNAAKAFMPIIKARQLRADAAGKQVAAAKGELLPSLTLFSGVGTGYFETTRDTLGNTIPFRDQFRDNTFKYIGLSLNVPIFNGWSGHSKVKQRKIERLRALNNLEIQEQELLRTVQTLVQDYNSLQVEYEQSNQKVKAQQLAFTIAQKRYERGLINALELFQAKNLFASAQNENLQVRLKSEINKTTLDFYRGLPVFDIQ